MSATTSSPARLYLMQIATNPTNNTPFVCYLVQTGDGKNILIDTGLPIDHELAAAGKNVFEQLAEIGLTPPRPVSAWDAPALTGINRF